MKALTNRKVQSRAPGSISKTLPPQVAPMPSGQPHTQEIKMKRDMKGHRGSGVTVGPASLSQIPRNPSLVAFSSSVNKDQNPQKEEFVSS